MRGREVVSASSRATIADVARSADVSTATVSRVLNGNERVTPELVARVQNAVEAMSYVPNHAGRALRRAKSDLWAVIIPDARNPFFTAVLHEFETVAASRGHSVVMCNAHESVERERNYIEEMIAQQVSGVVLAATSVTRTSVWRLSQAGIPLVLFDRRITEFQGDIVTVDNAAAGALAAHHMIEQKVVRPFILTGPKSASSTVDRVAGFQKVFDDANLHVPSDRILRVDVNSPTAEKELCDALAGASDIDGVFATHGPMTAVAFKCLQKLGWPSPRKLSYVGVDDEHWTRMVTPKVTVVAQPVDQLGQWAANLLETRAAEPTKKPVRVVLEPNLMIRESSLRP